MPTIPGRRVPLPVPRDLVFRRAGPDDILACGEVWRAGLTDYGLRVGRPPLPPRFGPLLELLAHIRSTDPERFVVATRPGPAGEETVAFGAAVRRGPVWFLSMLFVLPEVQGLGVGRTILEMILPEPDDHLMLATCTDSAQPISNALYSRYGIVPRQPVVELVGTPEPARLRGLPDGIRAVGLGDAASRASSGDGASAGPADSLAGGWARAIDTIDRATLGYAHPEDHGYLARSGRRGFLYEDAAGTALGYGYVAPSGRLGPVAVLDAALMPAAFGHLVRAVRPAGAFSAWMPGAAGEAMRALLHAGMRIEDFPALLCWDRPFGDFGRYVPITLAVL